MLSLIVATGLNNEIGVDDKIPWTHQKDDMKRFFEITKNADGVVMGNTTYESLPSDRKPLPYRANLVLTNNMLIANDTMIHDTDKQAVTIYKPNMEKLVEMSKGNKNIEIIIAGGSSVYQQYLHKVDIIYMTTIMSEFPNANRYFPQLNMKNWVVLQSNMNPADDRNEFAYKFEVLIRKSFYEKAERDLKASKQKS